MQLGSSFAKFEERLHQLHVYCTAPYSCDIHFMQFQKKESICNMFSRFLSASAMQAILTHMVHEGTFKFVISAQSGNRKHIYVTNTRWHVVVAFWHFKIALCRFKFNLRIRFQSGKLKHEKLLNHPGMCQNVCQA